jgi:3,8-divinyl chlorophyllide a/chlorophyllide a reductase subunit Y
LLVARLLIESGADVAYVGTACAASRWSAADRDWLESRGVVVKFRASLADDLAAADGLDPDLVIGTTPVVQHAKQRGTPALYFTNLISARPLMGPAGAGLGRGGECRHRRQGPHGQDARFLRGGGRRRYRRHLGRQPQSAPRFPRTHQKKLDKAAKAAKAQEMI